MVASALIYVVAVPLVCAAVAAILMRLIGESPRAMWAVGVGLGYVAGHMALKSQSGVAGAIRSFLQPAQARDWVPHAVLLGMAVTILATYTSQSWRRWIGLAAGLLAIGVPIRLLSFAQRLSLLEKLSYLPLLAATLGTVWLLLAIVNDDEDSLLRSVLIAMVAAGSAMVIVAAGSMTSGQACGVVGAAVAGVGIAALLQDRTSGFSGAASVVTMSIGSLIFVAYFFAELSAVSVSLLFAALVAAGGPMPAFVQTDSHWFNAAIRTLLCSIPMVVAILGSLS
jgi:hypothetical protein